MIKHNSGKDIVINPYKKAVSVAFAMNDLLTVDASGFLIKATAGTTLAKIIGLIQKDVLVTDADYAQNTYVPVLEVEGAALEFIADVGTGSATQAMVGLSYDLKDHNSIDVTAVLVKAFKISKVISTTKVLGRFVTV